jgi:hypothetical protein
MKITAILSILIFVNSSSYSQGILNKVNTAISQGKNSNAIKDVSKVIDGKNNSINLSNEDIISGLKEALTIGTQNSAGNLSKLNGFFGNEAIKIVMPTETGKMVSTLRKMGMGVQVDKAILSMNRAAEDASASVGDIFINAIKKITITDGLTILKGSDTAATNYLKQSTQNELAEKIRPIIEASLKKVDATKYWKDIFSNYNKYLHQNINTDLAAYVTEKTTNGLFYSIAEEEKKIRKNPAAQVTDILKKVFGGK